MQAVPRRNKKNTLVRRMPLVDWIFSLEEGSDSQKVIEAPCPSAGEHNLLRSALHGELYRKLCVRVVLFLRVLQNRGFGHSGERVMPNTIEIAHDKIRFKVCREADIQTRVRRDDTIGGLRECVDNFVGRTIASSDDKGYHIHFLVDTTMSLRYTSAPGMRIPNIDPELRKIADTLIRNGKKAYLVGGAVRDAFLKRPVTDFDIATDATPQESMRLFPWAVPTGIQHGTITVIPRSRRYKVEITTFRTEGAYTDGRHPDSVAFIDDISLDLSRRDFTINAMAFDLATNVFVDPFGGRKDLEDRIIRAVGNPLDRFHEDGLRTIRAIRFASQLGFVIEPATLSAIVECRGGLLRISAERIRDEFSKILGARKPSVGLQLLVDTGTVEAVAPELVACKGVTQPRHGAQDVLAHLFATTDAIIPDNLSDEHLLILRLAALFHDIGKPLCRSNDKDEVSFYGHELESEKIARRRLLQLKYPNAVIDRVCHLIRHHMFNYEPGWTDAAIRRFIARVGLSSVTDLFALRLADTTATTGGPSSWPLLSEFKSRIDRVVEAGEAFTLKDLAVNGDDLAALGIPRTREMGALLSALLDAALEDPSLNTKEKMLEIARAKYFSLQR